MPGDNEIEVRIVADGSSVKAEADSAAASVERLGEAGEQAGPKIEKIEGAFAHVSGHIAGHALGMGRMARSIATVGEAAIGVGPFLAIMLPIAAIILAVEAWNKYQEAVERDKEAISAAAEETHKMTDKLAESKIKVDELTASLNYQNGALLGAKERAAEFGNKLNELGPIFKRNEESLKEQTHWYNTLAEAVRSYSSFWTGTAGTRITNDDLKERLRYIQDNFTANKDYTGALRELQKLQNDLAAQADKFGGDQTAAMMRVVQDTIQQSAIAARTAANEQKALNLEVATKKQEEAGKAVKAELDMEADAQKQITAQKEREAKENAEFIKAVDKEIQESYIKGWAETIKTQGEAFRASQKESELAVKGVGIKEQVSTAGVKPGMFTDMARAQAVAQEMTISTNAQKNAEDQANKLSLAMLVLSDQMTKVDTRTAEGQKVYDELNAKLDELAAKYDEAKEAAIAWEERTQELSRTQLTLAQQVSAGWKNAVGDITNAFNNGFDKWITGSQTFGRAMQSAFAGIAKSALESALKIAEAGLIEIALHKAGAAKDILISAKQAAAKAAASVPFPLNIPVAAATFAGVMALAAFEHGGIVGDTGPAILHKNEMVLPQHIASFVQKAAQHDQQGSPSGGDTHFHYSPNIAAIDRNGMEDALRDHSDAIFTMVNTEMRRRNMQ